MTKSAPNCSAPLSGEDTRHFPVAWTPWAVIAMVALFPWPSVADSVMSLAGVGLVWQLLRWHWQGATAVLDVSGWAVCTLVFLCYWLPQLVSFPDSFLPVQGFGKVVSGLRYLPVMWVSAIAVSHASRRTVTFIGLAAIVFVWMCDGLWQWDAPQSPLFQVVAAFKARLMHSSCLVPMPATDQRLSGIFGPCNLKYGQYVSSLSPFLFYMAHRWGRWWGVYGVLIGLTCVLFMAGSRASWVTFAVVLVLFAVMYMTRRQWVWTGILALCCAVLLVAIVPQVRARLTRTAAMWDGQPSGLDHALSGRQRIWQAAMCVIWRHPMNGVGVRQFRYAYANCDPDPTHPPVWGQGPALHAHQLILEVLAETGLWGLACWLAGAALLLRAWRYADASAQQRAAPTMMALLATVFPLNTHLAFYANAWGDLFILLVGLYCGALLGTQADWPRTLSGVIETGRRPSH